MDENTNGLPPLLLTKQQVSKLTGIAVRTIDRLVSRRVLRVIRVAGSRSVRFNRKEIENWVEKGCKG